MDLSRLYGVQYVRIAPGAAETLAPYLDVSIHDGDELVVTVTEWPRSIRVQPLPARDGRLIAGDPLLLAANTDGLVFDSADGGAVLVPWTEVTELQVLGEEIPQSA